MPDIVVPAVSTAFAELIRALRAAAMDAPLDSDREAAFLAAIRRIAERWDAGEASPMRSGAKKEA
jgi:hypothetical protein